MSSSSTAQRDSSQKALSAAQLVDAVKNHLAEASDLSTRLEEPNLPAVREAIGRIRDQLTFAASHLAKAAVMESVTAGVAPRVTLFELALSGAESAGSAALEIAYSLGPPAKSVDTQTLTEISKMLSEALASRALLSTFASFQALRFEATEDAAVRLVESLLVEADRSVLRRVRHELDDFAQILAGLQLEVSSRRENLLSLEYEGVKDHEWLTLFCQAVEEAISQKATELRGRTALRFLMTHLDVGQDELGRLFGVSGETVRRWERGKSSISSGSEAAILAVESAVRRLLEIFCRDRLPLAIRRKAKLFNGETALEWILRGRIEHVVESYERTLLYQA